MSARIYVPIDSGALSLGALEARQGRGVFFDVLRHQDDLAVLANEPGIAGTHQCVDHPGKGFAPHPSPGLGQRDQHLAGQGRPPHMHTQPGNP